MKTEKLIALSGDKTTNAETLRKVYAQTLKPETRFIDEIKANLAENPNTPIEILLEVGWIFLKALDRNPAINLILLECPNFPELLATANLTQKHPGKTPQEIKNLVDKYKKHVLNSDFDYPHWYRQGLS